MKVRSFEPSMSHDVVTVYNRMTSNAPYCYPLDEGLFETAVTSHPDFAPDGFFVAYDGETPVGLIHTGFVERNGETHGAIMLFLAEDRGVCDILLDRGLGFLRRRGVEVCHVMAQESGNMRFYSGVHMGYEVALWQGYFAVVSALRRRGFESARLGFMMAKALDSEPEPISPGTEVDIRITRGEGTNPFYTNGRVEAYAGEERIGLCGFYLLKQLSAYLGKGIGQIDIGVNEQYRRLGVATALLSRAHLELYRDGARRVILATNYAAYPAIRLYRKLGYIEDTVNLLVLTGILK
ncbi:GNAT family N-acetyltransferase [Planctomycetota bacterium]